MKVTKSAIYRLEVETSCGCKAIGEYDDAACKKPKGPSSFKVCEKHKDSPSLDVLEMMLTEVLEKEALQMVEPQTIHPRTAALRNDGEAIQPESAEVTGTPSGVSRSLRISGSSGDVRGPSVAARPRNAGSHRPEGKSSNVSPFRRADPSAGMSANAAAALAGSAGRKVASSAPPLDIDDVVPEDLRITRLLEKTGALGDIEEDEEEDFGD